MAEIKAPKKTDYRRLFIGNHVKNSLDKNPKRFEWIYELRNDRKLSKLTVQEIEIKEGEKKEVGKPVIFDDIYCKLTRLQARNFVRNLKG